jgi:hypothetical protein
VLLKKLCLLLVAGVLSMGICELVLRVVIGPAIVWKFPQEQYVLDPDLVYALRPLHEAFTHDKPVIINSLGLRDREYPRGRGSGITRIVALGDSQTFGNGLDLAETWPKQLESALNADGEPRWEVVNGGLPASSTRHQSLLLGRILDSMQADLILVALYVNDVGMVSEVPPFPIETRLSLRHRVAYLLKRSTLFTAFWQACGSVPRLLGQRSEGYERELAMLKGEYDRFVEQGWKQVEESLGQIKRQAADSGGDAMVVVLPRRDQVSGLLTQTAYNDRVRKIADELGLKTIDVLSPLRAAYVTHANRLFIAWDGHHSALANGVVAQTIRPRVLSWSAKQPSNRGATQGLR